MNSQRKILIKLEGEQSGKASWSRRSLNCGESVFTNQRGVRAILETSHRKTACSRALKWAVHEGCGHVGEIRLRWRAEGSQGHKEFFVPDR